MAAEIDTRPYASCAKGLEALLRDELTSLGVPAAQTLGSGVRFDDGLEAAYRACLYSHVANRVLWPIHQGVANTPEALYALAREIDWSEHLAQTGSLAVDFFSAQSAITHTQFGALKVKDAVVDQFRENTGVRPDVERQTPDVRINVYVHRDKARFAIDLSGSSLHRRGYRQGGGQAPLKETLAGALLLAADWPARARAGEPMIDPMCGSGTLVVEAACMAAGRAPGLGREYFGFLRWRGHDAAVWERMLQEAQAAVKPVPVTLRGMDRDEQVVVQARAALQASGIEGDIRIDRRELGAGPERLPSGPGLVISNPPWGERLSTDADDYENIGKQLSQHFPGWACGLFTARAAPFKSLGLPLKETVTVVNGGVDCRLSLGVIPALRGSRSSVSSTSVEAAPASVDVSALVNRLRKNLSGTRGWRRQQGIRAHRVYDADLPEFAVAIDVFDCGESGQERHVILQEYAPPRTVNSALAAQRLESVVAALPDALEVEAKAVHLKVRGRQRGDTQYQRRAGPEFAGRLSDSVVRELVEQDIRYELNFSDYLDVGLFLDHRRVRRHIRDAFSEQDGGRFLNLFAYTGAATLAAVAGGADSSVSVDLSKRYCEWAERNLAANGAAGAQHKVIRADVLSWLVDAELDSADVILLDPPTHSNSSATDRDWDVQTDHVAAIDACMSRLAKAGLLIFSNNFRGFKLNPELSERYNVEDRSSWSLSRDYKRNTRIHRCWFIKRKTA